MGSSGAVSTLKAGHALSGYRHGIVVGGQWGDEGKGKLVDMLAAKADAVIRFSGANNAGHTVEPPEGKIVLHYLPSGIAQHKPCVLAHGVLMNLEAFLNEIEDARKVLGELPHICIDGGSPIFTEYHALMEIWMEGSRKVNSDPTWKAVAQMQALYDLRVSLVVNDIFLPLPDLIDKLKDLMKTILPLLHAAEQQGMLGDRIIPRVEDVALRLLQLGERIYPYVFDTRLLMLQWHRNGWNLLFEGAQATLLDQDWGTYNAISSGKSTALGVPQCTGLPLSVFANAQIIVAVKPYETRVGNGPMVSEIGSRSGARTFAEQNPSLFDPHSKKRTAWLADSLEKINQGKATDQDYAHYIESLGMEKGATTGRGRSPGHPDPVMAHYAVEVNGATSLAMMRLDMCSGLLRIPTIVRYQHNGADIPIEATSLYNYRELQPKLEIFHGWTSDISGCTEWKKLPPAARDFIEKYEEIAGAPIKHIGTGPGREAMICR